MRLRVSECAPEVKEGQAGRYLPSLVCGDTRGAVLPGVRGRGGGVQSGMRGEPAANPAQYPALYRAWEIPGRADLLEPGRGSDAVTATAVAVPVA